MRRRLAPLALLLIGACTDAPTNLTGPAEPQLGRVTEVGQLPAFQPGVVVARFEDPARAPEIASAHGAAPARSLRTGAHLLTVPQGREQAIARALSRDPRVVYAELSVPRTLGLPCNVGDGDCRVPFDNLFGLRWDLHNDGVVEDGQGNVLWNSGLVPDADMDWLEAFDQLGAFTGSAVVGVIDTGIFGDHQDLAGRLIAQRDHFNVDDIAEDDNGHGTHVSGIVLAHADNGAGAAGVAYGPNLRLVVSKGCGLVSFLGYICWSPDIADGIAWAVDNGANVINLSLGGDEGSVAEQEALQYALANDVLPVCAAGNDKSDVDFPAAFPECMAVSATDWADQLSSYSSFGPEVEVAAPGGDTILAGAYDRIASTWNNGGYVYAAGTSMASPQVAGLAALLHALGVTGAEAKRQILRSTADDRGPAGFDTRFGHGRINVWSAVLAALGEPPPPPPPNQPPTASFTASCADNTCSFIDTSADADGIIASRSWDFGDGGASSAQSPSHSYAAAGDYVVTLIVTDNAGASDSAQQAVTVTDPPPNQLPSAAFTSACEYLSCVFSDASTDPDGSVVSWSWDLGDGTTSSAQGPSRAYAAAGDYTVTLTVTDDRGGTDVAQQTVTVEAPPPNQLPVADFTWVCDYLACAFTNTSTDADGTIRTSLWEFGDGSTTNAGSPAHFFPAGGDYTVRLTVTDDRGGAGVTERTVTVEDPPPPPPNQLPTAGFTWVCDGLGCAFTNTSTDPDGTIQASFWEFGDSWTTNAGSPIHVYASPGDYTVRLTVTDDRGGTDVTQQTITVEAPPPPNQLPTAAFTNVCDELSCAFNDASTDPDGGIAAWQWDFGDSSGSTVRSPTHVYATEGTYTVTLTVTDDLGGTDTVQQDVIVQSAPPPVVITLTATGSKVRGRHVVDLSWTGTATVAEVHRDASLVATVAGSSYQDQPGGRGQASYAYRVCEAGTSVCSNQVVVVF